MYQATSLIRGLDISTPHNVVQEYTHADTLLHQRWCRQIDKKDATVEMSSFWPITATSPLNCRVSIYKIAEMLNCYISQKIQVQGL